MIPALVRCLILLPGELLQAPVRLSSGAPLTYSDDTWGLLEADCRTLYSVERKKALEEVADIALDADGRTTETILGLCGISEARAMVGPLGSEFLSTWFGEGGYDMQADRLHEIYEIAERHRQREIKSWMDRRGLDGDRWDGWRMFHIDFLALFVVETSKDFETGIPDVDDVYLHCEGKVVPDAIWDQPKAPDDRAGPKPLLG